jgi:hypothetical protein
MPQSVSAVIGIVSVLPTRGLEVYQVKIRQRA